MGPRVVVIGGGVMGLFTGAGRIVWAVVCTDPDTIPSARPSSTIIVPK